MPCQQLTSWPSASFSCCSSTIAARHARAYLLQSGVSAIYLVLERALAARDNVKASHTQALSAARINKDKGLGYLLADMLDEDLPSPDEAEQRGKRVAAHITAEARRIEKEKVRFAEQARAVRRSAGDGGPSEVELRKQLADIEASEHAAIQDIENAFYRGWERPSSQTSRAAAQREEEHELTPEV